MISADLATIWAAILAFAVFAYAVLDGFVLGVGILFPRFAPGDTRDQAMNAIAPVWDSNQTWLILGGGGLFAAFPLAYAILMTAVYPPICAMLLALIFRGVAFKFRWRNPAHRPFWDFGFWAGSTMAAFCQGVILGALLQGVTVVDRAYGGGWLDWLTPFSLLTGFSVVAGDALLGSCWLIAKTEGEAERIAYRLARWTGALTVLAIVAVSAATPFLAHSYVTRWFTFPGVLITAQVPLLITIVAVIFWRALMRRRRLAPLFLAVGLFALSFVGLGISMFPYVIPRSVTIWDAAAPAASQAFMLVGAGLMLPVILAYTAWSYWVFWGKVGKGYY
ncbi:cytochrome d ubiquinol oxidase subunit II [Sphingomonas sp.]|uniref:cytochrome d ubiquinol oxidase subunit II n=1 Tax=Sphingomonas sp. TaxID=28214 RepID=UPI001E0CA118|nr:cytochrome d ubiquinol oxidase subunit II [Sphingomonas sp.]MBX9796719.1 cytochrome d ubiquinol oxidase subunit II [Sphingomonas sp.]